MRMYSNDLKPKPERRKLKPYLDKSYDQELFNLLKKRSGKFSNIDISKLDDLSQKEVEKLAIALGYNNYVYKGEFKTVNYDKTLNNEDFFRTYGIRKEHSDKQRFRNIPIALKSPLFGYNAQIVKDYLFTKTDKDGSIDITDLMTRPQTISTKLDIKEGETGSETINKNRIDSFLLYAGLPQFYNTYDISKYKPNGTTEDVLYFDVKDRTGLSKPPENSYYYDNKRKKYIFKNEYLQRENQGHKASTIRSSTPLRQSFTGNDNYFSKEEYQKLINDPNFIQKIKNFKTKSSNLPIGENSINLPKEITNQHLYKATKTFENFVENPITGFFNTMKDVIYEGLTPENFYKKELEKIVDRDDILLRQDAGQRFWNFKTQIGKDNNGRYASYYDLWDLAPIPGVGDVVDYIADGKPFEFYSRDYYPLSKEELKEKQLQEQKIKALLEKSTIKSVNKNHNYREIVRDKTVVKNNLNKLLWERK